jgi:hypothetical protein
LGATAERANFSTPFGIVRVRFRYLAYASGLSFEARVKALI